MEGVESALLVGVAGPSLATIEQRAQQAGLVYFHLVADGQHTFILLLMVKISSSSG